LAKCADGVEQHDLIDHPMFHSTVEIAPLRVELSAERV
jgi:hypothetical protein